VLKIAPTSTLSGNGSITPQGNGALVIEGTVSPGASPGRLTVFGAMTNTPSATLLFELIGTTPDTQHDVLALGGRLVIAGTLAVDLPPSFLPRPNDAFTIITATSFSGTFSNVLAGKLTYQRHSFDVVQTSSSITLRNYAVIPEATALHLLPAAALLSLPRRRRRNAQRSAD
jgi:hypothetical protein